MDVSNTTDSLPAEIASRTILVTGGSGFVGHHLITALKKRFPRNSLRVFDAKPSAVGLPECVEVVYGRIEEPGQLAAAFHGAEVVIHLAAKVQPDSRESKEMWRINVEGTRNVYLAAVAAGCRLFLHLSSAGIYGLPRSPNPFSENDIPMPVTPYQVTKWEAEQALRQIEPKGTTLNILRPAGIYGPGSDLEIPAYKKILAQRWPVELTGGVLVHPTYVGDVVEACLAIMDQPAPHGTVLNIGGEKSILLQDLQALIAETLGIRRRRVVLPSWFAGPVATLAGHFFALLGRPKPLLGKMGWGHLFSSAVDDRRFRLRYPNVSVLGLRDGLQEHLYWASTNRLL